MRKPLVLADGTPAADHVWLRRGARVMTGSTLGVIFIPIVALLSLACWLGMVYYAAAHPGNRARRGAPPQQSGAAYYRATADQAPPVADPVPEPRTPGDREPGKVPAAAARQ
jgi:hypothetical protein